MLQLQKQDNEYQIFPDGSHWIQLSGELQGTILDLGGGGEGVIGRLYGSQVTAIDNRQEELEEAPGDCRKLLMDAADLQFGDREFDHVTSFYTLMYMNTEEQRKVLAEANRVLKTDGTLHIWDCDISSAYPEPFSIDLQIQLPDACISTTYGIVKRDSQNREMILQMCQEAGLRLVTEQQTASCFYLCFRK